MNEGDISIVFSQFGEIVDLKLERDKKTGKSKGYAFICYENQKSTILAVDNFNNTEVCGRTIRVDHVKKYRVPKEFLQVDNIGDNVEDKLYKPTGPDGRGWGKYRELTEDEKKTIEKNEKIAKEKENKKEAFLNKMEEVKQKKFAFDEDERVGIIFNVFLVGTNADE